MCCSKSKSPVVRLSRDDNGGGSGGRSGAAVVFVHTHASSQNHNAAPHEPPNPTCTAEYIHVQHLTPATTTVAGTS